MIDQDQLRQEIERLQRLHKDLDAALQYELETSPLNHIKIQQLKKSKLQTKDLLRKLTALLIPDIIA